MDESNIKSKLLEILSGYVDVGKLAEREGQALSVDSMMLLEIVTVIETEMGVVISDEEVERMETFENMVDIVNNKFKSKHV